MPKIGILNNLNMVLAVLQQNAITIGFTVAGLLVAFYAIKIMLDNDNSPQARTARWESLTRVIICAVIIAAVGAFITFARQIGGAL